MGGWIGRWIHKQLLPEEDKAAEDEPDSDRASALRQAQALETQLLLTGRREIDGPMEGSSGGYPPDYLVEDVRDLSRGQRCAIVCGGIHPGVIRSGRLLGSHKIPHWSFRCRAWVRASEQPMTKVNDFASVGRALLGIEEVICSD